ncbi:MAG: murein biosynthesis integral membrane protein MurJ [Deltaproteobacteria bacterium]
MADEKLVRSTGVVGAAVLASRLLGLVREQIFAGLFGAGRELDAFVTAFRIPNLFRDLFAEGALSAAFVTTFSKKLEKEGEASAWRLANLVIHALVLIVGTIVVLGIFAAPWIVDLIAPGFREVPGKSELTIELTRLLFPFLLLVALAAIAMGMLNARNRFGVAASASSFFNLGSILAGMGCAWWLAPDYVSSVFGDGAGVANSNAAAARAMMGMAIGTLVGGLLQLLVQLPSLHAVNFRYRPMLSFSDPGLREVLRLMGPATLGAAAVQVNVLVNTSFASGLGDGAVSWLNVAFRFMQLPIGLFGVAVGMVALPSVSRRVANDDMEGMRAMIVRALRLVLALCIPAAVGLAVLAPEVIGIVYQHGLFDAHDTRMAANALIAYALGLAGYANIKVLVPAFYALGDARTPAWVSGFSIGVNVVLAWTAIHVFGMGHVALALTTSVVACTNFAILFVILRRRIGRFDGLASVLPPIAAGAVAVALVSFGVRALVLLWLPEGSFAARFWTVAAALPLAAGAFGAISYGLGLVEVVSLVGSLRRRLGRGSRGDG